MGEARTTAHPMADDSVMGKVQNLLIHEDRLGVGRNSQALFLTLNSGVTPGGLKGPLGSRD